jgi:crossover junction endonuclease EME1
MQRHFEGCTLIYLIEGIGPWMRKNRNLRNRQFASAVRGNDESSQSMRRATTQTEYIDEDVIEEALLELQVVHGALIHHTNAGIETAQWIVTFTQHISTVPYRRRRDKDNAAGAGFCMEPGQVRTGDSAKDTYVRMLQEITRVTAPIAFGIAAEFESVGDLVRGLEQAGPLALQDCYKCNNKDGDRSERTIGQAVSRRMYKVFTGRDETSTEV